MVPELGTALAQFSPYWPQASKLASQFNTEDKHFTYGEIGVNYDNNSWWAQAEMVRLDSDTKLIPSGDFGYASLGKRFGNISLYGLGGYATPKEDVDIIQSPIIPGEPLLTGTMQALAYAAQNAFIGARIDQNSIGLGVRWDFAQKMSVKLQAEQFHIEPDGASLWFAVNNQEPIVKRQSSTVFSLTWDLLF